MCYIIILHYLVNVIRIMSYNVPLQSYRTPLHYAYGLTGEERTLIDLLVGEGVPLGCVDVVSNHSSMQ